MDGQSRLQDLYYVKVEREREREREREHHHKTKMEVGGVIGVRGDTAENNNNAGDYE